MRKRGTAVVIRHGNVLLVRDKGKHHYSLPGGGCHKGERSLRAKRIKRYIGSFKGAVSEHKAYEIEAEGHVHLRGGELSAYMWWNMKVPVPVYAHVKAILGMLSKH